MTDRQDNEQPDDGPAVEPIAELRDLVIDPDPELEGRVQRDINRRTLAADSLDFSLTVMLHTFWEHLRILIESWPSADNGNTKDQ